MMRVLDEPVLRGREPRSDQSKKYSPALNSQPRVDRSASAAPGFVQVNKLSDAIAPSSRASTSPPQSGAAGSATVPAAFADFVRPRFL